MDAGDPQHADSLDDPGNVKLQQRWWIGVTPMEAELYPTAVRDRGSEPVPGLATKAHADLALDLRQTDCYTGPSGLFVQGGAGCDSAPPPASPNRSSFSLNTAVMAVGEGNYGRLGRDQQQRYTTDNRELMLPDPDEQPGALPEIGPSPDFTRNIDRPFNERSMVMQAWDQYGVLWPVVHQQLGVRPDLGFGRLEVVPQLPEGQSRIAGSGILVGDGSLDVSATHEGKRYTTTVDSSVRSRLLIGHTIPDGAQISSVTLNGMQVRFSIRHSNRGQEILVSAGAGASQRLVVTTA